MEITIYERGETMVPGLPEDHLVGLTKPSVDRILKMQAPGDCLALYAFYCYTRKWQKNNAIFATSDYAMTALDWGRDRFARAKSQLKEHGFIEDIPRKSDDGKMLGWFVKVSYAQVATLGVSHTTEKPQHGKSAPKYPELINEIPFTNKEIPFDGIALQQRQTEKQFISAAKKLQRTQQANPVEVKETPPAAAAIRPSPNCAAPLPELHKNKAKVNQMFRRRDNTVWSDKERKALENTLGTTEEEWAALIEYYSHAGEEGYFCRTAPLTAMNNWAGEIDKAKLDRKKKSAKPTSSETNKLAGGIAGREDEFWAWVHSKRPWEERRPTRAVPEEWVWDFLNGTKEEDLF